MSQPQFDLDAFRRLIANDNPDDYLPVAAQRNLLLNGCLLNVLLYPTDEAIVLVRKLAEAHPDVPTHAQALEVLARLAVAGQMKAVNSLYELAINQEENFAAQIIHQHHLTTPHQVLQAVFSLLHPTDDGFPLTITDLHNLANGYQPATSSTKKRLLACASSRKLMVWAAIVQSQTTDDYSAIPPLYPNTNATERQFMLERLEQASITGSQSAANAIIQLFLLFDDPIARDMAQNLGISPLEPSDQAVFLFLTGQIERYAQLDFDHRLLIAAYQLAGPDLRQRLLAHSRFTGYTEWMQALPGSDRNRWLSDLNEADWQMVIDRLSKEKRWEELWRLSLLSPASWSVKIMLRLKQSGWSPHSQDEQDLFASLAEKAQHLDQNPISIEITHRWHTPFAQSTSMAVSGNGHKAFFGTQLSEIYVLDVRDGNFFPQPLIGPAATIRALSSNQDGTLLAAALGDNTIRIFRHPEGKLIKTMDGHTNVIRSVMIHPDQRTLYSAGFDGSVRAWRFPLGAEIKKIEQRKTELYGIAIGHSGEHLLSAGTDGTIVVWKLPDGIQVQTLTGHTATVTAVATSPTANLAASYGSDRMIRIWNYVSGKCLHEIQIPAGSGNLTCLALHPVNQLVVAGDDHGRVHLWSISTGTYLQSLNNHQQRITGMVVLPGGDHLMVSSLDGNISCWSMRTYNWLSRPVSVMPYESIDQVRKQFEHADHPVEKKWLGWLLELLVWKSRFDVLLGDVQSIPLGEFDIQL